MKIFVLQSLNMYIHIKKSKRHRYLSVAYIFVEDKYKIKFRKFTSENENEIFELHYTY